MKWRSPSGMDLHWHFIWMTMPRRRRLSSAFKQQHQIFGFFFHFNVTVAQNAEHAPAA